MFASVILSKGSFGEYICAPRRRIEIEVRFLGVARSSGPDCIKHVALHGRSTGPFIWIEGANI
jgi:hypothetical protein